MLLALITASVGPVLTFTLSRNALESSVIDRLNTATTLKEAGLNRWIADREEDIILLSQDTVLLTQAEILLTSEAIDPLFSASYQDLSAHLENILEYNSSFAEIFILADVGGEIILSTNHEREGEYRVTDTYFTEGRHALYTQNVYPSLTTGKPIITIAIPIINPIGQHIGVLAVHLNMEKLDTIILERAGLGTSGETYLVDQFNSFVSEAKFGHNEFPRGVHTMGIDAALAGKDGSDLYLNYEGTPVIGVYQWVEERNLALLAEISQEEAFTPARRLTWIILLVGLGSVLIAGIGIYFVAQQITGPILAITATATEIAAGDLNKTAPVLTKDEIGTLAQAFNSVTARTRDLINTLEERVAERTRDLELRSAYLEGAAEVSRAAASILESDALIRQVVELIKERFVLYYVGLFLIDEMHEWIVLQAGTGEAGRKMLARNHRLKIGEGMTGWSIAHAEARIALDVGEDAVRFDNPDLPETRSEGALPLRSRGRVFGALTVQSSQPAAFNQDIITTLQTMADQIAVAFDNAELFAKSEASLEAERRAYGELSQDAWKALSRSQSIPRYLSDAPGIAHPIKEQQQAQTLQALQNGQIIQEDGLTAIIPLKSHGQVLGGVRLRKPEDSGAWTQTQIELVETLSEQLGVALESARLYQDTQRRAARERLTGEVTARMRETLDIETVLKTATREFLSVLNLAEVEVRLSDNP
ncbi:MAG: GAF domain-containing protein [Chloroflexi bacterium]|nr:GAF domain-containing protein [Chloroflexota bacterium]